MEWVPPDANDLKEKLLLGTTEGEVLLLEVSQAVFVVAQLRKLDVCGH